MEKIFSGILIAIILPIACSVAVYSQEPLWKIASDYEKEGKYSESISVRKQMAKEDYGTEWYIDDIAGIARCYSYTAETDSTVHYCDMIIELAEQLKNVPDSVAEQFIQSATWSLYRCNQYERAYNAAEKVLKLRKKMFGEGSPQYLEWLGCMSFQAYKLGQIEDMVKLCHREVELTEKIYGISSKYFEEAISSIRRYAHQLIDQNPQFTIESFEPYYRKILELNILPQYQYEFEVLLLDGYLSMEKLQQSDIYAQKLHKKIYSTNTSIPQEDVVTIKLKLANYYCHTGDHIKARIRVENAWKDLANAKVKPSLTHLIYRHIVERKLRMDTLGRERMNIEWILETASSVINDGNEDEGVLAFFYESRAWAYGASDDYVNAINNIKKSIELKPLDSRKKKLAQFYVANKQFELAEHQYLRFFDDLNVHEVLKRSIESDLCALYWQWGKLDKLGPFLEVDFKNMKSDIKEAFAFMNDDERQKYLSHSLMGGDIQFDIYTGHSNRDYQWNTGNCMAYNLALVQKGLLLNTSREIREILKVTPDSLSVTKKDYEFLCKYSMPGHEDNITRDLRIKLMSFVATHPQFLSQLSNTWEDVKKALKPGEASIEFINLLGVKPEEINAPNPGYGALILRYDSKFPIFVRLLSQKQLDNIYVNCEGECEIDAFYSVDGKHKLYQQLWAPLEQYLSDVNTVYYAPTGSLQIVNLDWIGNSDADMLCHRYNLHRVSSTRQIMERRGQRRPDNAILYGDITYSLNTLENAEISPTKYRSLTRAGFVHLTGTSTELDTIKSHLIMRSIPTIDLRKDNASEPSFYSINGMSPNILHIATHGFYYSREALTEELRKRSFIGFQITYPELYHSGLAFAGAQDTWKIETFGDVINFDKYSNMDESCDGILLSAEIADLDLQNTDLVVLSACETALGKITADGVYGLQRAFKLAGVNSIIMSLWKVDDDATQLLMTHFYKNYLSGMSKREALQNAQNTVRTTPGFKDPYYWAAFILLDGLN